MFADHPLFDDCGHVFFDKSTLAKVKRQIDRVEGILISRKQTILFRFFQSLKPPTQARMQPFTKDECD